MSKSKLTGPEWQIIRDAPFWVFAALAAADNKQALLTSRKESKALDEALESYQTNNALIRDVLANEEEPAKEIRKASSFDVEQALGRISQIVENKLGSNDLDKFNEFLLAIGQQVAASAGEGVLGIGENVSKRESAALEIVANSLRATDAQKRARHQEQEQEQQRQQAETKRVAEAKREAEAKAKQEAEAKAKREAEVKAKQEAEAKAKREAEMKAKQEAEAKAKREAEMKAKQEAESRAKKQAEERAARTAALAREQAARLEAKQKADAAAAAAAAQAAEEAKFIAEHTVVSGDNLSFIAKKYYGGAANWKLIYEANKNIIGDNPNLIRVGQVFKIPRLPEA